MGPGVLAAGVGALWGPFLSLGAGEDRVGARHRRFALTASRWMSVRQTVLDDYTVS